MTATTDQYRWTFLFRDSQRDDDGNFYGHSFYAHNGRVAVKDMSGDLPHLTDDGVLWVDFTRPVRFYLSDYCGTTPKVGFAALPVVKERTGERSMVGMLWPDAVTACRQLELSVSIDKSVADLCRLVTEVAILAMEHK